MQSLLRGRKRVYIKFDLNKHHSPALTREVWQDDVDQKNPHHIYHF